MSDGYICPFCNRAMSIHSGTFADRRTSFERSEHALTAAPELKPTLTILSVKFYKCPSCGKTSVQIDGVGEEFDGFHMRIIPFSESKHFPEYIPKAILEDYEEACAIIDASPKAAATLARRCLQGMIRDFWEIKEKNLNAEITALKNKIPASQWKAIDALRKIGNIGAHMEKDVDLIIDIDHGEAQKLIKLIEHLLEQWYVNRHDQEQLYLEIAEIDEDKQSKRHLP